MLSDIEPFLDMKAPLVPKECWVSVHLAHLGLLDTKETKDPPD